jgi:5'-nucleotidase/UDP-sugar diphosphatase
MNWSRRRKLTSLTLFIGLFILAGVTSVRGMGREGTSGQAYQCVTVLHTNDIQGHFTSSRATWLGGDSPPKVGGIASYARFIREEKERSHHENCGVLVVDAGDWFTGTPASDLSGGRAMVTALNEIPLDVTTLGNHEFDVGPETLIKRVKAMEAPVLASNVRYRPDTRPFPGTADTKIIQKQGIQFGFFSLLLDEMPSVSIPENIEGVHFQPELERARELINQLRADGADVVVALTHVGLDEDKRIARAISDLDLIIGSHSHTRLDEPLKINETIVAQAGDNLTAAGRIDLELAPESGEILRYRGGLVSLYHDRYPPLPNVKEAVEKYIRNAEEKLSSRIARATRAIPRSSRSSSPLGNLITDAMRTRVGVDLAFQNPYGIRDQLSTGPITLRDLYTVLPFGNTLVEMDLTGKQLRELFEQSASMERGLIQFSGGTVRLDFSRPEGQPVRKIRVAGEPIKPDQTYRIVTNNFLAPGGDKFLTFKEGTNRRKWAGTTIRDAVRVYLEERGTIRAPREDRYLIKGEIPE